MLTLRATNRTQRLVLGFFVFVLVAILTVTPQIYEATLNLGPGGHPVLLVAFLIFISAFIALLGIGVLRRWRWIFWLILIAFLSGIIRVIASALQLMEVLPPQGPEWYVAFQAAIGVVQFLIALAMIAGYRKGGVWGAY
jgi:hypothetical protein